MKLFDDTIGSVLGGVGIEGSELPIVGGLFGNPEFEKYQQALAQNAQMLQAYRQPAMEARGQAFQQQLGALSPANQMLGAMYGPAAMVDLEALGQNPFAGLASDASFGPAQGQTGPTEKTFDVMRQAAGPMDVANLALLGTATPAVNLAEEAWNRTFGKVL